jgi:hypothetical protein
MKCLYCHENVQPEGDVCPKCGLPLIEDTTLLELGAPARPAFADWLNERKPIIIAAAGGFVAALAIGVVIISTHASADPAEVNPISSYGSGSFGSSNPGGFGGGSTETPAVNVVRASTPSASEPEPTVTPNPVGSEPAAAPVEKFSPPPTLPHDFEYDPAWNFPPPPKPSRKPRKRPDAVLEPTPPSHALVVGNSRARMPQFVTIVPNRGTVDAVDNVSGPQPVSLPSITGE